MIEDAPEGCPVQISSVVQNRGSIPLFWSQETSRINIKPDIICMMWSIPTCFILCGYFSYILLTLYVLPVSRKDKNYEATRLHFENLVKRYGNPIIILNLIKVKLLIQMIIHSSLLICEKMYNLKCSDLWTILMMFVTTRHVRRSLEKQFSVQSLQMLSDLSIGVCQRRAA